MDLLQSGTTLIDPTINRRRNGKGAADDGTDTGEEVREGLGPGLAVDDLHGADVVGEENTGDATMGMQPLLMALCGVCATT